MFVKGHNLFKGVYSMREVVFIVDVSGQYAQVTARRIREREVYCEVVDLDKVKDSIALHRPVGIVLTGDDNCKELYTNGFRDYLIHADIPTLAIGAAAAAYEGLSYPFIISLAPASLMGEAAMDEVSAFLYETCGCIGEYTPADFANETIERLKEEIKDKKVICGLSGGVDSTVSAVMLHKAIGNNLTNIFVDNGLLRKDEGKNVIQMLKDSFDMNIIHVHAEDRFLEKLKGITVPAEKRMIIGALYIDIFREEAEKLGDINLLAQGTIYTDVLESGHDGAKSIKMHHNVGGLPKNLPFELVEPVRYLFKDEVRRVGVSLGLPEAFTKRQSFPGPGLGVRCLGELSKERLDVLRECDAIVREEIEKTNLPIERMQYFAVLPNLLSVGVEEGAGTYLETVAIRAIQSIDLMTADYVRIPYDVLDTISNRIISNIPQINRVVLDISPKPPSTIEWE